MIPTLRVGDHIFVNKLSYGVRVPLLPLKIGDYSIPALAWNWTMPERGDVIVFIEPEHEEEDYIKRVVAIGGDKVEVKDGQVFINDKGYPLSGNDEFEYEDLDEDGNPRGWRVSTRRYTESIGEIQHAILRKSCVSHRDCIRLRTGCDHDNHVCHQEPFGPYRVPDDHVFVMGDNRDNSRDSRVWKSVPMKLVKGRAEFIWWSYRQNLVQWRRMFTGID
jgi:signal peptidase I